MKRITIELPKGIEGDRSIYVFDGVELIARKVLKNPWQVKTVRCDRCGKCCMDVPADWKYGTKNGNCQHLKEDGDRFMCVLGSSRPFSCCVDDETDADFCRVTWEEVK